MAKNRLPTEIDALMALSDGYSDVVSDGESPVGS